MVTKQRKGKATSIRKKRYKTLIFEFPKSGRFSRHLNSCLKVWLMLLGLGFYLIFCWYESEEDGVQRRWFPMDCLHKRMMPTWKWQVDRTTWVPARWSTGNYTTTVMRPTPRRFEALTLVMFGSKPGKRRKWRPLSNVTGVGGDKGEYWYTTNKGGLLSSTRLLILHEYYEVRTRKSHTTKLYVDIIITKLLTAPTPPLL